MQTRAATHPAMTGAVFLFSMPSIIIFQHVILNSHYSRASTNQGQCLHDLVKIIFKTKALRQAC